MVATWGGSLAGGGKLDGGWGHGGLRRQSRPEGRKPSEKEGGPWLDEAAGRGLKPMG